MNIVEIIVTGLIVLISIAYFVRKFYKLTKSKPECICDGSCGNRACSSFVKKDDI